MSKSNKSKGKMIKVPKRVAGVKIPKAVRKGPVLQFVNSSAGKLLVAEAITAALGAIAYQGAKPGSGLKEGAMQAEDVLKEGTTRLAHAFAEGVRAFRAALAEGPGAVDEELEPPIIEADETEADGPRADGLRRSAKKGYRRSPPAAQNPV